MESPHREPVGREAELARIDRLLAAARNGMTGALAVEGEAGMGKSTLLGAAEERAGGFVRLRARGVESEAALGYAALLELLTPARDRLAAIPAPQAGALAAALGWGSGPTSGEPYLVAAATLSLLAATAEAAPVLVVVDDLQWVDRESAVALLFAARRLRGDAVAFLFAARSGAATPVPLDGIEALTVAGLPVRAAAALLPSGTAESVAARLVAATQGNPLALLEVAGRLTPAQRVGAAPLPSPLPIPGRLESVFDPLLTGLAAPCWRAVLLRAAASDDAAGPVIAALRDAGVDAVAALEEAERQGVLTREPGVLRFRHPLLRTAAWGLATPAQRRAAHAALAAVLPAGTGRTWHRAESATGPDDDLAAELAAVAEQERTRRGFAAASAALERAARLSADPTEAGERLAAAIEDAAVAGDVERARTLGAELLEGDSGDEARGRGLYALGVLEQYAGSVPRAEDLLVRAAELTSGALRVRALAELALTRFRLDDLPGFTRAAERIAQVADRTDPQQRVLAELLQGFVTGLVGGDGAAGRQGMVGALELMESEPALRDDPRYLPYAVAGAAWLGDHRPAVRAVGRGLSLARERGAIGVLVPALALTAYGRASGGDHAGAFGDAGEAAELAEELGYAADGAVAMELLAWEHAARGRHDDARRELDRAAALLDRAGTAGVAAHLTLVAAFCALCRGDLAEAAALLEARLASGSGRGARGEPMGVAPGLVEAYAGVGRQAEAAAMAERYAAANPDPPDPLTAALIARSRALAAADDDAAFAAYDAALAAHASGPDPFERARTQLLYGSRLRRAGRRVLAREQLRAARDAFAAMDLVLWAQRADGELRATGETARPRRPLAEEPLTSQETRVALLVARGLTNREVAAALFLSPKTVEHHLSSVYRKRGYRSRTELAATFGTAGASPS